MNQTTEYLREHAAELARALLGEPTKRNSREWRWGRKGSMAVVVAGERAGAWKNHETDEGGGPVELIMRVRQLDAREALQWAREWAGGILDTWTPPARPAPSSKPESPGLIEDARRIWAESVPVEGTPAERYLRSRSITNWPINVRFHPRLSAVVFKAESEAVQVVYLDQAGRKAPVKVQKRTLGSPAGTGVVLQQGAPGDPLILVEGPETGLSLATAGVTGTVVAVLSVSNFQKVGTTRSERSILLVGDGDPIDAPARRTLQKALREIAATGREVRLLDLEPTGDDLNDVLQKKGANEVRRIVTEALAGPPWLDPDAPTTPAPIEPFYPDEGVPLAEAELRTRIVVEDFFASLSTWSTSDTSLPPQVGVQVEMAVGKTHQVIEAIAKAVAAGHRGVIAVPHHILSDDLAQRLNTAIGRPVAAVWYGFERPDPCAPGHTMCRYSDSALAILDAGGDMADVCGSRGNSCEFKPDRNGLPRCSTTCGYWRQRHLKDVSVWIVASNMLADKRPEAHIPGLDFLVIDEDFHSFFLKGCDGKPYSVRVSDLLADRGEILPRNDDDQEAVSLDLDLTLGKLRLALSSHQDGRLTRTAFESAGLTPSDCEAMYKYEWRFKRDIPEEATIARTDAAAIRKGLAGIREHNSIVKARALFWRLLGAFLLSSNNVAPGLMFANAGQASACIRLKWCVDLHDSWTTAPILYLDGTMNERLARRWLPRLDVKAKIAVKATGGAYRRQVIDWSAAASKTTPGAPGEDEATQRRNAGRLARHIEARAAEYRGQGSSGVDVLVIGTKKLVAYLETNHRHRFGSRVELTWQGNIRGVDRWKDVPCLVIVGRLLPWPSEVEEIAGIIFDRVISPVPPDEKGWAWYLRELRGVRLRNGPAIAVNGACHPDPDAEAVRWSICEAELVQAEARVRAIRRTDAAPASIDIIANVCLPLTVDEAVRWDDLQPGPVEVAAARGGIPFSWSGMAKLLPDLFETPEAARQHFKNHPQEGEILRHLKTGQTPISSLLIGNRPLFEIRWIRVRYRLASGGYSADALVRADIDARVHLERILGALASFEVCGELDLTPTPVPLHEPRHDLHHSAVGTDLPPAPERASAVLPVQDPPPKTDDRRAPGELVAALEVAKVRRESPLRSRVDQGVVSDIAVLDPVSVESRARVHQPVEQR